MDRGHLTQRLSDHELTNNHSDSGESSSSISHPLDQNFSMPNVCKRINDSVFELYNPSTTESDQDMDILFFHGLHLRPRKDSVLHVSTWTSTVSDSNSLIWPKQWLPKVFPTARILTISYDASIQKTNEDGRMDLYLVAETLVEALRLAGVGHAHSVILIGHCFGGIVVKRLCLFLATMQPKILLSIKGIFYYATAHQGTDLRIVKKCQMEDGELVKLLRVLNEDIARHNHEFQNLRNRKDLQIHVAGVGESLPTDFGGGHRQTIVAEGSARCENITFVHADHFSICQPVDEKSTTYLKLVDFIKTVRESLSLTEKNSKATDIPRIPDLDHRRENVSERRKVLIFGKTGSGKSTLANMLLSGSLENPIFPIGNSMQGVTDECVTKEGLDYEVTDTVGFGEDTESERKDAQRLIQEFMRRTHSSYHHILFVKKASPQDRLDTTAWKIFLEIFKDYQDANQKADFHRGIVLVLTHCREPQKWLEENRGELQKYYGEVNNRFIAVDFPPVDPDLEARNSTRRNIHLTELRDTLDHYFRQNGDQPAVIPRGDMVERRKVLIVGKTGSGKSTLANMLLSGSLANPIFPMGNSMQGVTDECVTKDGFDYEVTDTVGLGEDTDSKRKDAKRLIVEFLRKTQGSFHHILFVKEASAQSTLDTEVWKIFLEIFQEDQSVNEHADLYRGIALVLTHCREPQKWLQDNGRELQKHYSEVNNRFIAVDFPPSDNEVQALEARRKLHLRKLKETLDDYFGQNGKQAVFTPRYPERVSDTTELVSLHQNGSQPLPMPQHFEGMNEAELVSGKGTQTVFTSPFDGIKKRQEGGRSSSSRQEGGRSSSRRKVLIVGRTGSGKSTLANMLVYGKMNHPDPVPNATVASSSKSNGLEEATVVFTRRITTRCGFDYEVTDTVGLGDDTNGERKEAKTLIRAFLRQTQGSYHHILFVKESSRQDTLDTHLWETFLTICQEGRDRNEHGDIHRHIVVVFTKCRDSEKWLEENREQLQKYYSEVNNRFIAVDFPPIVDEETEIVSSRKRAQHLSALKNSLDVNLRENFSQPLCKVGAKPISYPLSSYPFPCSPL